MTTSTQIILFLFSCILANNCFSQAIYNDLYYANLKGQVKSCEKTTESCDSESYYYGHPKKVISLYNRNGNCYHETEYLDSSIIQKRTIIFDTIQGQEKRSKKITTHANDTINKSISYYHFDETGFDTSIVVCSLDSSYFMLYKYEKNKFGLRSKGTEYNAKNGHLNNSFEIYYNEHASIDSIVYRNSFGDLDFTEYYLYNKDNEVAQIYYSDAGCTHFDYENIDKFGNWSVLKIYYSIDNNFELVTKQIRVIDYFDQHKK